MSSKPKPDSGWAWIVLIAVFSGILIIATTSFAAGVVFVELLDYYHDDAAKTSIIGSLNSGLLCLLGPLASFVSNKFSCRLSMLTGGLLLSLSYVISAFVDSVDILIPVLGVIGGIGNALVGTPFVVVLAYYFEKRRDCIMSLSFAVVGLGMFIASPLALFLLETYGLKGTFLLTGGICAQLCVCAILCRPSQTESDVKKKRDHKVYTSHTELSPLSEDRRCSKINSFINVDLLTNIPLLAFLFSTLTWNFMLSVCMMHLPNYVTTKGLGKSDITLVMTLYSIANTVGRLLGVLLVNQHKVPAILLHMLSLGCGGIITIFFPTYSYLPKSFLVFASLNGLFSGLPNTLMPAITIKLVGVDQMSSAHGLEYFFCGLGIVVGPPIAGLLYEQTNSYEYSLMAAAAVMLFGSVCPIVTYTHLRRATKQEVIRHCKTGEEEIAMIDNGTKYLVVDMKH